MPLITIGVNHKTAPIEVRERLVFAPETLPDALSKIYNVNGINEVAILSTCNRTELYCHTETNETSAIINWLHNFHQLTPASISHHLYSHKDESAVSHILRVASGLDSLVMGEPQILGQLKDAYRDALKTGTMGNQLTHLFHHTFSVAKQVRTDTEIGSSPVSVAFAAVSLAKQIFAELPSQTCLLIGAGDTIELAARHLYENGISKMIIANRTIERAQSLGKEFDAYAITLEQIPSHLAEADIIISSTASQLPILKKEMVKKALKQRKHKPMFIVDIAVPRDVESSIGELDDVYLYTVDDLHDVIQDNLKSREEAALQAEEIIETQVQHFMGWLRSLDTVDLLKNYRQQAQDISNESLEKALAMLQQGKTPQEALQYLSYTLTNKLIHNPTVKIKQAGYEGNEELIEIAKNILGIK